MANDSKSAIKISGCLEKKGKLRMVSSWKKYWFVLEGRLLLYYRSRDEYEALSPCKGSISLCPPCTIKPTLSTNCVFQIVARGNAVTLRAENRSDQERWMHAILTALDQSSTSVTKLTHFRYSLDDLAKSPAATKNTHDSSFARQNTLPHRLKTKAPKDIIERLQNMGAQTYGGSLDTINKMVHKENMSKSSTIIARKEISAHIQDVTFTSGDEILSKNRRPTSIMVDNDQYSRIQISESPENVVIRHKNSLNQENIYDRVSSDSNSTQTNPSGSSSDLQNEQYCVINKRRNKKKLPQSGGSEITTDYNKNSVLVDNDNYVPSNCGNNEESSAMDKIQKVEEVYEDINAINNYQDIEPCLPPRPSEKKTGSSEEISSQSSTGDAKIKSKVSKFQKLKQLIKSDKKRVKVEKKRSPSFINRMLNRKKTREEKPEDFVHDAVVENPNNVNTTDALVLTELQKILLTRRAALEKKIRCLQEPESCKEELTAAHARDVLVDIDERPVLPPRQNARSQSPYHDYPKHKYATNEKILQEIVPLEKIKTIDEILADLDKEKTKQESKPKVKQLIEKFSESQVSDEVVLRKKNVDKDAKEIKILENVPQLKDHRRSEELNKLLEELSKVTSAPILTPGVTISLIDTVNEDEEWLKLIPIRRRRFSDPDYDIPRPHRSLQLLPRVQNADVIPATRFFGPVLCPSTTTDESRITESLSWVSMDPDSLEPEQIQKAMRRKYQTSLTSNFNSNTEKDRSVTSYSSHDYFNEYEKLVNKKDEIFKADVTLLLDINSSEVTEFTKIQDNFVDSLEHCQEISTAF